MFLIFWLLVNHRSIYFWCCSQWDIGEACFIWIDVELHGVYGTRISYGPSPSCYSNQYLVCSHQFRPNHWSFHLRLMYRKICNYCLWFHLRVAGNYNFFLEIELMIILYEIYDRLFACMLFANIVLVDRTPVDHPDSLVYKSRKCHA